MSFVFRDNTITRVRVEQWRKTGRDQLQIINGATEDAISLGNGEWVTEPIVLRGGLGNDKLILRVVATNFAGGEVARISVPPRRFPKPPRG